ncbi:hypothetical protein ACFVHB_32495 [Kitasatospora sp. NPDC127111]|uniref:hypothetical protein n=1 Tax=Kitasatospora sp. NPDC127111 TaxID=3345363 RepID=UPI00363FFED6
MSNDTTFLAGLGNLPLRIERAFRPWSYSVSHRRLVLRTWDDGADGALEVEFLNVAAMKVRRSFDELRIVRAGEAPEIEEFADIPERNREIYHTLLLSDATHEGFVVCGGMRVLRI